MNLKRLNRESSQKALKLFVVRKQIKMSTAKNLALERIFLQLYFLYLWTIRYHSADEHSMRSGPLEFNSNTVKTPILNENVNTLLIVKAV